MEITNAKPYLKCILQSLLMYHSSRSISIKYKHKHNVPKRNNGPYLSSTKFSSRPRVGNGNAHQDFEVSNQS